MVLLGSILDLKVGNKLYVAGVVILSSSLGIDNLKPIPFCRLGPRFRTVTVGFAGAVWVHRVKQVVDFFEGIGRVA